MEQNHLKCVPFARLWYTGMNYRLKLQRTFNSTTQHERGSIKSDKYLIQVPVPQHGMSSLRIGQLIAFVKISPVLIPIYRFAPLICGIHKNKCSIRFIYIYICCVVIEQMLCRYRHANTKRKKVPYGTERIQQCVGAVPYGTLCSTCELFCCS
jgi:hypothetical protein